MVEDRHLDLDSDPGQATIVQWPPRTGKTHNTVEWIQDHPEYRYIWVAPTWGQPRDRDSGVAAAAIHELKEADVQWFPAGGKARTCDEWPDVKEIRSKDRGNDGIRWKKKAQEICGPCENAKDPHQIAEDIDEFPEHRERFPLDAIFDAGACPKEWGIARILTMNPGEVAVTTPVTFREAIQKARRYDLDNGDNDRDFFDEWCDSLVVVWDEAHSDGLMLKRADAEFHDLPSGDDIPDDEVPLPDFLDNPPASVKESYRELLDEMRKHLEAHAEVGWAVFGKLTRRHEALALVDRINEMVMRGDKPGEIETRIKNKLNYASLHPDYQWVEEVIRDEVLPNLTQENIDETKKQMEEMIDEFDEFDWSEDLDWFSAAFDLGAWDLLALSPFSPLEDDRDFAKLAIGEDYVEGRSVSPHLFEKLQVFARGNQYRLHEFQEALVEKPDPGGDKDSDTRADWYALASLLKNCSDGVLNVTYQRDREQGGLKMRLKTMDADYFTRAKTPGPAEEYDPPLIRPRYGPINTVLRSGGRAILLSATHQEGHDLERFLKDADNLEQKGYPEEYTRPKLRIAWEDGARGVRETCNGRKLREKVKRLLTACLEEAERDVHIITRNKGQEYPALKEAGLTDDSYLHYFRAADSLGVRWEDEEDSLIIALGPPRVPPTVWASLEGKFYDPGDDTDSILHWSRRWQDRQMITEFFQTICRTAKVPNPDDPEERVGHGILLAGRDVKEKLGDYAEAIGIEVEWIKVDAQGKMEERGRELACRAEGRPFLRQRARKILDGYPDEEITVTGLQEWHHDTFGTKGHLAAWKDAIEELEDAELVRKLDVPGPAKPYEWTDLGKEKRR